LKPLTNTQDFLKRFDNFKGGEIRSIEVVSPTVMLLTLAGQDEARAFDWISIKLECTNVLDARLLDNPKLSLLDMSEGISILNEGTSLAFGIGECYNLSSIKSSSCFIECASMKYEEGLF